MTLSFFSALLLATPVAAFAPTSRATTGTSGVQSPHAGHHLTPPLQATTNPSLEAILFDCDGVLADTERDGHRLAFNIAFEENGIEEEWGEERYGKLLEVGGGKERMTAHWNEVGWPTQIPEEGRSDKIMSLHLQKTDIFMNLIDEGKIPLRPGVLRLVDEAIAAGVRLAVCSTSNEKAVSNLVSTLMGEERAAKFQVFAGDMVKAKKPAPDVYLMAVDEMGLDKERCVIIEDSDIGVFAAVAAGISCLVTKSSYTANEDFTGAKMIVDELGDDPNNGVTLDTLTCLLDDNADSEECATSWDSVGHIEKGGASWTGARLGDANINKPTEYTASETYAASPSRGIGVKMEAHIEKGGASWTGARFGDDNPNKPARYTASETYEAASRSRGIGVQMEAHVERGGASWTGARFGDHSNAASVPSSAYTAAGAKGLGVQVEKHVEKGGVSWTGARFGDDKPSTVSSTAQAPKPRGLGVEIESHIEKGGVSWAGARFGDDNPNKPHAYSASETYEFKSKGKSAGVQWDAAAHTEAREVDSDQNKWSGARFGDRDMKRCAPTPSQWHE